MSTGCDGEVMARDTQTNKLHITRSRMDSVQRMMSSTHMLTLFFVARGR